MDATRLRRIGFPALTASALIALSIPVSAQCERTADEESYASDGSSWDQYSRDVAVDSLWIASGAPGAGGGDGAVYVYDRGPNPTEYRVDPVVAGAAEFGFSIDLWNGWLAVGDPGWSGSRGRVDLFQYDKSLDVWQFAQSITGLAAGHECGTSVSMDGGRLVVGAPHALVDGSVRLYQLAGGIWQFVTAIASGAPVAGMEFGAAVSYAYPYVAIGSPNPGGVGRLDVYQWNKAGVSMMTGRDDPEADVGGRFGASVHTDGTRTIVGKPFDSEGGPGTGAAYVLSPNMGGWYFDQKLIPIGSSGSQSGTDVHLRGSNAWLGAPGHIDDGQMIGALHRFQDVGLNKWYHQTKLHGFAANGLFGLSVDMDADEIFVGSPYDFGLQVNTGSLYRFEQHGFDLDVTPDAAALFDPVVATMCGGSPTNLLGLFAVGVDGIPIFVPITFGSFGLDGRWALLGNHTDPALSGINLDLMGLAITGGKVAFSNTESLDLL